MGQRAVADMSQEQTLLELIEQSYQAALHESDWIKLLGSLVDATGSAGAALHWTAKLNMAPIIVDNAGLSEEEGLSYTEYYIKSCPRFGEAFARSTGTVLTDYDVITERDMDRHELYADFLPRQGLRYFCGIIALNDESQFCGITIERTPRQGHIDGKALELVRHLSPHLCRAVQVQMHLDRATSAQKITAAALDRLHLGVILVDETSRPIHMNRIAEAIIKEADGLASARHGIVAATATLTAALGRAISEATKTGKGDGLDAGQALVLPRPSGRRALEVVVAPSVSRAGRFDISGATAVVLVNDPERRPIPSLEALRQIYGLTPVESELAAAACGRPFAERIRRRVRTTDPNRPENGKAGVGQDRHLASRRAGGPDFAGPGRPRIEHSRRHLIACRLRSAASPLFGGRGAESNHAASKAVPDSPRPPPVSSAMGGTQSWWATRPNGECRFRTTRRSRFMGESGEWQVVRSRYGRLGSWMGVPRRSLRSCRIRCP